MANSTSEKSHKSQDMGHVETIPPSGTLNDLEQHGIAENHLPRYGDEETTRILRKVDLRLLPVLTLLYIISYLDRGNIGNARVAGMNADLGLSDTEYRLALTIFFIPYALFEVPSNMVLKLMRPSTWIAILVVTWGTVMTCQGLVQNAGGLMATRFLLGVFEAGFFPAASYLLGDWYCRFEIQWRLALFYSAASLAGAFSGLLAFALDKMDGLGKLEGWRWIFIIEGIVTVVVGTAVPWVLPDSPATASFLTVEEKALIKHRLEEDSGTASGRVSTGEKFQWRFIKSALMDWKIWFTVFIFWGNTIPIYAFTFIAPTIIHQLGYSAAEAQLMTIPIYFTSFLATLGISWLADRRQRRWPFIVGPYTVALLGFIGLTSIPHPRLPGLTYAFLFAIPAGVHPGVITLVSWMSNNLSPTWKRAVGMAMTLSLGNLGGVVGSNIYLAREAPRYWTGYGTSLACAFVGIMSTLILRWAWSQENKRRDQISESEVRERYTDQELLDLGDKSPLYRYVL